MKKSTELRAKERELNGKMRAVNERSVRLTKKRNQLNKKLAKIRSHGKRLENADTTHKRLQKGHNLLRLLRDSLLGKCMHEFKANAFY